MKNAPRHTFSVIEQSSISVVFEYLYHAVDLVVSVIGVEGKRKHLSGYGFRHWQRVRAISEVLIGGLQVDRHGVVNVGLYAVGDQKTGELVACARANANGKHVPSRARVLGDAR
jgi:hypothetical protein